MRRDDLSSELLPKSVAASVDNPTAPLQASSGSRSQGARLFGLSVLGPVGLVHYCMCIGNEINLFTSLPAPNRAVAARAVMKPVSRSSGRSDGSVHVSNWCALGGPWCFKPDKIISRPTAMNPMLPATPTVTLCLRIKSRRNSRNPSMRQMTVSTYCEVRTSKNTQSGPKSGGRVQ